MYHKIVLACVLLACVNLANAHMYLAAVVNGKDCVRPHPTNQYDYPISDKNTKTFETSDNMICGWNPALNTAAKERCPVAAGSKVTLQWWHAAPNDDVVDASHRGPCIVYMAKAASGGRGQVWFKVYEEGYNAATNEFCTDRIRKDGPSKGQLTITIPSDIAAGDYLLRSEFLALHEAHLEFGTQPYVGCADITVSGGGSSEPSVKVAIPGLYKKNDDGILFNIYYPSPVKSYPIPGPALYVASGSSGSTVAPGSPTPAPGTPTSAPGNSSNCSPGTASCQCSGNPGRCSGTLRCLTDINICVPVECTVGSEGCPCTSGGACDGKLSCLSKVCVDASALENEVSALKANSASSIVATIALTLAAVMFALL